MTYRRIMIQISVAFSGIKGKKRMPTQNGATLLTNIQDKQTEKNDNAVSSQNDFKNKGTLKILLENYS